jgi:hypothetical protein
MVSWFVCQDGLSALSHKGAVFAVYQEFQEKWRRRATPVQIVKLSRPKREWLEEFEAAFLETLGQAQLTDRDCQTLLQHAKAGRAPVDAATVVSRLRDLQALELRFAGFKALDTALVQPVVLQVPTDKVFGAMLVFQDLYTAAGVGPSMINLAKHILDKPQRLATNLIFLGNITHKLLGAPLPLSCFGRSCPFLSWPTSQIQEGVEAFAIIFGRDGATAILTQAPSLLKIPPSVLVRAMKYESLLLACGVGC